MSAVPAGVRSEMREPGDDVVERHAERQRERRRAERVVDVVEPGQLQLDPARPVGRDEIEGRTLETVQLDGTRYDVERRTCMAAVRACVVTEVPDVGGSIDIRRPAADAVLRIGGVLQRRPRDRRVVDPVHDARAERADLRIVAVQHEHRRLGQRRDRSAPPFGDELELAVAVELVAEEVPEADDPWPHPPQHLRQRPLVDLEQAELGVSRGKERDPRMCCLHPRSRRSHENRRASCQSTCIQAFT